MPASEPSLEDSFSYEDLPKPYVFIQWKGTDACIDFHCVCGTHCHCDDDFLYYVQCPTCSKIYQMPFNLFPREVEERNLAGHSPILMQAV